MTPADLVARWRVEADAYERDGVPGHAALLRRVATELEGWWRSYESEELTVAQAAAESGYSRDRLRELVRARRLPDARPPGSRGEIRLRRADLPRKPQRPVLRSPANELLEVLPPRRR